MHLVEALLPAKLLRKNGGHVIMLDELAWCRHPCIVFDEEMLRSVGQKRALQAVLS